MQTLLPSTILSAKAHIMRNRNLGYTFACFFLLASPSLLFAQFQEATPDELKMTADPKAPGAAAVFLNIEEIANDPMHYQSYYVRIKILQEKGNELATIELPYLKGDTKITDIKARTIHADGTIIPLIVKPEDLMSFKTVAKNGDQLQVNRAVFTLPSAEVGSILEYRYELRYDDNHYSSPTWEIQRPYFVHKAHYSFTPFKGFLPGSQNATSRYLIDENGDAANTLIWWKVLPQGVDVKNDVAGHFAVDITDVPPIPNEEWMPPIQSLLYKVRFYYKSASNPTDFWMTTAKRWSKQVDHFAEASKSIRDTVAGLVAPGDTDVDKAKKLYQAVQSLDNTDFSRKKGQTELRQLGLHAAKRAEDTWSQKSGSSEDIALLYVAMLRAAGLTAFAAQVADREDGVFDPTYMYVGQLSDTVVLLNAGGKDIVLDPGEKMCPFQTVSWRHSGASGIRQSNEGRAIVTLPAEAYPNNNLVRSGDVTLDEHGAVTGDFRFVMKGQEALYWRQEALRNDPDEVKKSFDESLREIAPDGVEAHVDHFLGLDDPNVSLMAIVKIEGTLGAATSKRLLLPGFFFDTRGGHPFVGQEKRLEAVDMHYGDMVTDQVVYHFPAAFSIEGSPQDTKLSWAGHAALTTKSLAAAGQITIARQLARAFTLAKPEEYQDLRGFYQKVAAADQQQLVLTASPVAKGN
jgi:hypothetical protein